MNYEKMVIEMWKREFLAHGLMADVDVNLHALSYRKELVFDLSEQFGSKFIIECDFEKRNVLTKFFQSVTESNTDLKHARKFKEVIQWAMEQGKETK